MRARTLALGFLLALGLLAAPAAVPALEAWDVAPAASAARCVIGSGDCIIPIYCVRDCDCDPTKQYFRECDPDM